MIYVELNKSKKEQIWGRSCFFGEPDMFNDTLKHVADDEIFIAQINIENYKKLNNTPLLPKTGLLQFFIKKNDLTPIIRYEHSNKYNPNLNSRVDFNSIIESDYDLETEYTIKFEKNKTRFGSYFFNEDLNLAELMPNEIILLCYDSEDCSYLNDKNNVIYFVIKKDDLIRQDYTKTSLIISQKF